MGWTTKRSYDRANQMNRFHINYVSPWELALVEKVATSIVTTIKKATNVLVVILGMCVLYAMDSYIDIIEWLANIFMGSLSGL